MCNVGDIIAIGKEKQISQVNCVCGLWGEEEGTKYVSEEGYDNDEGKALPVRWDQRCHSKFKFRWLGIAWGLI